MANPTNPYYISALTSSYQWNTATIKYTFDAYDTTEHQVSLSEAEKQVVRDAYKSIETFTNLHFTEVTVPVGTVSTEAGPYTIAHFKDNAPFGTELGYSFYPDTTRSITSVITSNMDVLLNGHPEYVGYAADNIRHEIGHSLGLRHPFSGSAALADSEQNLYGSIMAYNYGLITVTKTPADAVNSDSNIAQQYFPGGYMPYDIAALQSLYGANHTYHAGNDVYTLSNAPTLSTLWDGGGTDEIDTSLNSQNSRIDLREGVGHPTLVGAKIDSNYGYINGSVTFIAYGANIENATAGAGNDQLFGNGLNNRLNGGAGNDTLNGGLGNDTLLGGAGNDLFIANAVQNQNTQDQIGAVDNIFQNVTASDKIDLTYYSSIRAFSDLIITTVSANIFAISLPGSHTLTVYAEGALKATDFVFSGPSATSIMGTEAGDNLKPGYISGFVMINIYANTIFALGGNDTVDGGEGNDYIHGGEGNDLLIGGPYYSADKDTLIGGDGNDTLSSYSDDNLMLGGAGNDQFVIGGTSYNYLSSQYHIGSAEDLFQNITAGDKINLTAFKTVHALTDLSITTIAPNLFSVVLPELRTLYVYAESALKAADFIFSPIPSDSIVTGTAGNDSITETTYVDMDGDKAGAGRDTIFALDGNDYVNGGDGNDYISGGAGNDTLLGGAGNDQINALLGNNYVDGGTGNDTLCGDTQSDTLLGGDGNDYLSASGGHSGDDSNYADGGAGDDTLDGADSNDTFLGGAGDDSLFGHSGDDSLAGGDGNDILVGWLGNDLLNGGNGNDTLLGGMGNDVFVITVKPNAQDQIGRVSDGFRNVSETDKIDLTAFTTISNFNALTITTLSSNVFKIALPNSQSITIYSESSLKAADFIFYKGNVVLGTQGNDNISGLYTDIYGKTISSGADTVIASNGNDTISALEGNDSIDAGEGNDLLIGGAGNDTLSGGAGSDTYNFTFNNTNGTDQVIDTNGGKLIINGKALTGFASATSPTTAVLSVSGTAFTLTKVGGDLEITKLGNSVDKVVVKNFTNNWDFTIPYVNGIVDGTAANNLIDATYVDKDGDQVTSGADIIQAGSGSDTVKALAGNDTIDGGAGNNSLDGGAGNDVITTGSGADTLFGGAGNDTLSGGGGADNYVFTFDGTNGVDRVNDFTGGILLIDGKNLTGTAVATSATTSTLTITGTVFVLTKVGADLEITKQGDVADKVIISDYIPNWRINLPSPNGTVSGTADNDLMNANYMDADGDNVSDGANNIVAGAGNDTVTALGGNDTIDGGAGNDFLIGGNGNDVLIGNAGSDTLIGGAGADTFMVLLNQRNVTDTIQDFTKGVDHLAISNARFQYLTFTSINGGTLISEKTFFGDTSGHIFLADVNPSTLTASDFLFT